MLFAGDQTAECNTCQQPKDARAPAIQRMSYISKTQQYSEIASGEMDLMSCVSPTNTRVSC
jgi:hypothetical protein